MKDDAVYVEYILTRIQRINEYVGGDRNAFFSSTLVQDAVIRNLQVLAESSQRVSDSLKSQLPEVPWRDIAGFRNILVHDYLGVDLDAIWLVVERDLPPLKAALERVSPTPG